MSKKLLAMLFAALVVLGACSDDGDGDLATQAAGGTTTEAPTDDTDAPEDTTDDTAAPDTTETPDTTEPTGDTAPGGLDPAEVEEGLETALSDSLGGLTGGSSELPFDDEQMTCMLDGVMADPGLLESLLAADADPTYVASGEDMASLFGVLGECDLTGPVAESLLADMPGLSLEQAECFVGGMIELPAETWDALMGASDPTAPVDPAVATAMLELITTCDIPPTAFS